MCKYEMDPTSIVEDTERARFYSQTDRRTDKVKPVYYPFNFVEAEGIIIEYNTVVQHTLLNYPLVTFLNNAVIPIWFRLSLLKDILGEERKKNFCW